MKHNDVMYGYYNGGDPRKFSPDPECSTEEERERHRLACEAWDRGETPDPGGPHDVIASGEGVYLHVTRAHYGLGVSQLEWDCEGDPECFICAPPPDESESQSRAETKGGDGS